MGTDTLLSRSRHKRVCTHVRHRVLNSYKSLRGQSLYGTVFINYLKNPSKLPRTHITITTPNITRKIFQELLRNSF